MLFLSYSIQYLNTTSTDVGIVSVQVLILVARSKLRICAVSLCLSFFLLNVTSAVAGSKNHYVVGARCLDAIICKSSTSESIITEFYRRIGATVEFLYLPRLREIEEAQKGRLDAISGRTKIAIAGEGNLVAVPVPYGKASIVAFVSADTDTISTLDDLTGRPIAILRGDYLSSSLTGRISTNIIYVDNILAGLKLVKKGHADAILYDYYIGLHHIQLAGMKGISASPVLATANIYHAVHKKNADLLPKLSDAIVSMHKDGTMKRLFAKFKNNIPAYPLKMEDGRKNQ